MRLKKHVILCVSFCISGEFPDTYSVPCRPAHRCRGGCCTSLQCLHARSWMGLQNDTHHELGRHKHLDRPVFWFTNFVFVCLWWSLKSSYGAMGTAQKQGWQKAKIKELKLAVALINTTCNMDVNMLVTYCRSKPCQTWIQISHIQSELTVNYSKLDLIKSLRCKSNAYLALHSNHDEWCRYLPTKRIRGT